MLVAPGEDGELAMLPHHAPLLTTLKPGEMRVVKDGEESYIAVSGGFLEMIGNTVTVLADTAERAEEIDVERSEEALRRARERISEAPAEADLERAMATIRRSQARLMVARRRRRGGAGAQPPAPPA